MATSRAEPTRRRIEQLGIVDTGRRYRRRRGCRRRPRHSLRPDRRIRRRGPRDRPAPQTGRHPVGCRLRQRSRSLRDLAPHVPAGVHLIPAHPVAGTEHSGPDAGFAELFVNRWCILTPPEERRSVRGRSLGAVLDGVWRQRRDHVGRTSRPGAGGHQPCPPFDRIHHRRHGVRSASRHASRKSSNTPPAGFATSRG